MSFIFYFNSFVLVVIYVCEMFALKKIRKIDEKIDSLKSEISSLNSDFIENIFALQREHLKEIRDSLKFIITFLKREDGK